MYVYQTFYILTPDQVPARLVWFADHQAVVEAPNSARGHLEVPAEPWIPLV